MMPNEGISSMVTTQTRVEIKSAEGKELFRYFSEFKIFYNMIQRKVWHDILRGELNHGNKSNYISALNRKYNILKRTSNSIVEDMLGRYKALKALKETELQQALTKLNTLEKRLNEKKEAFVELKPKVTENKATEKELKKYRNLKTSIYWLHIKIRRLKNRIEKLKSGKLSICFGTKKLWRAQHNLEANGFKTHEQWLKAFREKRDSGIYYLGDKSESYSNPFFKLEPIYENNKVKHFDLIKTFPNPCTIAIK